MGVCGWREGRVGVSASLLRWVSEGVEASKRVAYGRWRDVDGSSARRFVYGCWYMRGREREGISPSGGGERKRGREEGGINCIQCRAMRVKECLMDEGGDISRESREGRLLRSLFHSPNGGLIRRSLSSYHIDE